MYYRILILSLIAAAVGMWAAAGRGRSPYLWALLSFMFPPLLVVLLMLPPMLARGRTKRCPHCAEIIKHEATVCRYCQKDLPIEMTECPVCKKFVPSAEYCSECNNQLR